MSNSLEPDQTRNVGPDQGPNCLQRLSVDVAKRQIVKELYYISVLYFWAIYMLTVLERNERMMIT